MMTSNDENNNLSDIMIRIFKEQLTVESMDDIMSRIDLIRDWKKRSQYRQWLMIAKNKI